MNHTRFLLALSIAVAMATGAWAAGPAITSRVPTPLRIAEAAGPASATALTLDGARYARLRGADEVILTGFPLDATTTVDLALERFEVFTPGARIVVATGTSRRDAAAPDVVLLRGTIVGEPDSSVFLGLSPHGSNGIIDRAGRRHIVAGGRPGTGADPVIYDLDALPAEALRIEAFKCGLDLLPDFESVLGRPGGVAVGDPPACSQAAQIAVETDWQFTWDLFGGDTEASTAYVAELIGAVSEIYLRDVGTTLLISYLRVWAGDTDTDLWDGDDDAVLQLLEFQNYYNAAMQDVDRHTAHFLSGRALASAGGVAYRPGLCQGIYAYGLSGHLNGTFPYPLEDNHPQNWDVDVVAHELGHNFGAPHTHEMEPPIDQCAYGGCENADQGTIMSYCHTCEGGVANIVLRFHERIINEQILPYLQNDLPCALTANEIEILEQPEGGTACIDETFALTVVAQGEPPLTYQWRRNGADIAGATGAAYILDPVAPGDGGTYDVVIVDACNGMLESEPAVVVVDDCSSPGPCPWDLDDDGAVGVTDFLDLIAHWGPCGAPTCPADFNSDNEVGVTDFLALIGHWGDCPLSF